MITKGSHGSSTIRPVLQQPKGARRILRQAKIVQLQLFAVLFCFFLKLVQLQISVFVLFVLVHLCTWQAVP
jgi:hypothetical protein